MVKGFAQGFRSDSLVVLGFETTTFWSVFLPLRFNFNPMSWCFRLNPHVYTRYYTLTGLSIMMMLMTMLMMMMMMKMMPVHSEFICESSHSAASFCSISFSQHPEESAPAIRGRENSQPADGQHTNTLISPPQRPHSGVAENVKTLAPGFSRSFHTCWEEGGRGEHTRARAGNRLGPGVIPAIGSKPTLNFIFFLFWDIYLKVLKKWNYSWRSLQSLGH